MGDSYSGQYGRGGSGITPPTDGSPSPYLPVGGTTGQYLAKTTDINYDADWVTVVPGEEGDLNYVHDQALAATEWEVPHGLLKFPSVMVVDTSNRIIFGEVTYEDINNVTITFSSSVSGKAYLN
jgi:hypothetical protein